MRPIIKWVGGKVRQAPAIAEALMTAGGAHCSGTYVEPFFGSGAVFFELAQRAVVTGAAVLADDNQPLMAMWRNIRHNPDNVFWLLNELHPRNWETWKDSSRKAFYSRVRDEFNADQISPLGSARFIWLNHATYNGLYRVNAKGEFNAPIGSAKVSLPSHEDILEAARLLGQGRRDRYVLAEPAIFSMRAAGEGDFVYVNPPFVGTFSGHIQGGFSMDDHEALALECARAVRRGATVAVSNTDTSEVRSMYSDFTLAWQGPIRTSLRPGAEPRQELLLVAGPAQAKAARPASRASGGRNRVARSA